MTKAGGTGTTLAGIDDAARQEWAGVGGPDG